MLRFCLLLQEGENNDKFFTHPKDIQALAAYLFVHNHLFYLMELVTALLLLLLSLCEAPAVPMLRLGIYVRPPGMGHSSGVGWGGNPSGQRDPFRDAVEGEWNAGTSPSRGDVIGAQRLPWKTFSKG